MSETTATWTMLGRAFRASVEDAVRDWLKAFYFFPDIQPTPSPWEIVVQQHQTPVPAIAKQNAHELSVQRGTVWVANNPEGIWISESTGTVALNWHNNTAHLDVYGPAFAAWAALMVALNEALRLTGLVPLHGALACNNDQGLLLVGPSGRGKTSTLLAAMDAGWQAVAEDFSWLEPQQNRVWAWDHGLRLLPDTLARVQQRHPQVQPVAFERGKHVVPYEAFAPRTWSCPLTQLALLERDAGQASARTPLGAAQTVVALFVATGIPLSEAGKTQTTLAFQTLAKHVQASRLLLGNTPLLL